MPSIRIRKPFVASFAVLLLAAGYLGLSAQKLPDYGQIDKGLHFVTFFVLTVCFYWILETSRRRVVHLTLLIVTAGLAIGSEVVQALLPNERDFDPYDILANVVGSALALALCSWYHKRMLERRRKNRSYDLVPGEEEGEEGLGAGGEGDVELGEGVGRSASEQETGSVPAEANGGQAEPVGAAKATDVTAELDNWDENEEDWEQDGAEEQKKTDTSAEGSAVDANKHTD